MDFQKDQKTPNQMLSRLSIFLAQLKAGYNSEILGMKLGKFCILCTDQKKLQNNYIKPLINNV